MSPTNVEIVRRFFEEVFNEGNLDVIDRMFTRDFILSHPEPGYGSDLKTLKAMTVAYRTAFPDLQMKIEDEVTEGNKVAIRFSARGTHLGPMADIPPSGKIIDMRGIAIYRIENGRIAQDWVEYDELGMLRQMGVVPTLDGSNSAVPQEHES
jgi:steroid delta-isomerase-like uncharacterized protein